MELKKCSRHDPASALSKQFKALHRTVAHCEALITMFQSICPLVTAQHSWCVHCNQIFTICLCMRVAMAGVLLVRSWMLYDSRRTYEAEQCMNKYAFRPCHPRRDVTRHFVTFSPPVQNNRRNQLWQEAMWQQRCCLHITHLPAKITHDEIHADVKQIFSNKPTLPPAFILDQPHVLSSEDVFNFPKHFGKPPIFTLPTLLQKLVCQR